MLHCISQHKLQILIPRTGRSRSSAYCTVHKYTYLDTVSGQKRVEQAFMKPRLTPAILLLHFPASAAAQAASLDSEATACRGSAYTERPSYGAAASRWGLVGRGGWRGAVLGPGGDKIYGIPTNASSVCRPQLCIAISRIVGHWVAFFHLAGARD